MKAMNRGTELPPRGSWTHSNEEDEPGLKVYRPTHAFAFPPARGRETLDFTESGGLIESGPGPDDRPRSKTGQWTALGAGRFRLEAGGATSGRVIEVVASTAEILKIRDV